MRRIAIEGPPPKVGESFQLPEQSAHYVVNVLRCEPGEALELFDGDGNAWVAELADRSPATVEVLRRVERSEVEPRCRVTLYQAMPKGDRFEWVLEKATELGVARIVPLETARSVVRIPSKRADKKLKRWRKIVTSAARQSGRVVVPEIAAPQKLKAAVRNAEPGAQIFGHPDAENRVCDVVRDAERVGVWIGPEGGFTDDEIELLSDGATGVTFGPRILRSETAGIITVALVQEHTGGLGR